MKTMKLIDILVKVANKEEVPIFEYEGHRYKYNKEYKYFDDLDNDEFCKPEVFLVQLDDEIKIIEDTPKEDNKLPKKLGVINYCEDQATLLIHHKVDEIIDYLKAKKGKKIKKLEVYDDSINWCCNGRTITDTEKDIIDKLTEIIDKINGE